MRQPTICPNAALRSALYAITLPVTEDVKSPLGITSMMDHNHSPHPRHTVKRINAPQSVCVDAASGVAKNSGFCSPIDRSSQSFHFKHPPLTKVVPPWETLETEKGKHKPPGLSPKKASRSTRTSMQDTRSFAFSCESSNGRGDGIGRRLLMTMKG